MPRVLLALLIIIVWPAWAVAAPAISTEQLDGAEKAATAALPADDPALAALLKLYGDTRATLAEFDSFNQSLEKFSRVESTAPGQTAALQAELARLQAMPREVDAAGIRKLSLDRIEQEIKLGKADLAALKGRQADIRSEVDAMPTRTKEIRARLTDLGALQADLESQLALFNQVPLAGGEEEARLWLVQAQLAARKLEKASLDAELLSAPVRQDLLKAQLDKLSIEIGDLERRLQALSSRAGDLREGEVVKAQAEAALAQERTRGKHQLVQDLAGENAELSTAFTSRTAMIEEVRQRDAELRKFAEQLEADLESIQHKLEILGMTTAIGQILRAQSVQLPGRNDIRRESSAINEKVRQSSLRQIEFEEERRQLRELDNYVNELLQGQPESLSQTLRDDLWPLATDRRNLVKQAMGLENTYAGALGDLEFTLRRHQDAVQKYRAFIEERLLWIPARAPFSILLGTDLGQELVRAFAPGPWLEVLLPLPGELLDQPLTLVCLLLVVLLAYFTPRLQKLLLATGQHVGRVSTDRFMHTMQALGYSLLLSFKWPLLLLTLAWLFEHQQTDTGLANALYIALSRTAFYFWVFELQRMLLLPGGLAEVHFRWPRSRAAGLYERILRLEQGFLPAALLVILFSNLYPQDVGGVIGALALIVVLVCMAYFFHRATPLVQGKVDTFFVTKPTGSRVIWGRVMRRLLVLVPVLGILGVLLGYTYTSTEFALLLIRTILLLTGFFLVHELGLRWLRITRRRMTVRVQEEIAQSVEEEGDLNPEEELLENDPELLSDEGTKFLNAMVIIGGVVGLVLVWAEVLPALGILESVELWHYDGIVEGREAIVPVTLSDLLYSLVILLIGWVAVRRIPSLLEMLLRQRLHVSAASAYAATRIFQYVLITLLVMSVMGTMGGSWSQIQWAVAALSVGIGFGLQEIVANFISGLIILFEQPIRVGDTVTVGETSGVVTKIRMRATTIRDWDRRELLVPNKEFVTSRLLNWSLSDAVTRCTIRVGVAYGTDVSRALEIVRQECLAHSAVLGDPAPVITFDEFGDNSLHLTVRFYLGDLDSRLSTSSEVRLAINERFNKEGIVVSFPQRDVHLDASDPVPVRIVREEAGDEPAPA